MNRDIPPIVWIIHPRTFQDIEKGDSYDEKATVFFEIVRAHVRVPV